MKKVSILGIRGIPASHGGFETFAQYLSLYLNEAGWDVDVYCQVEGSGVVSKSKWNNINLIHIPVNGNGALSTVVFDLKSILHACKENKKIHLTLGYNSGCLNLLQRIYGIPNFINMDGIEWKRQKWGGIAKVWLWVNERLACWFGNHLIADHPEIQKHLKTRVNTSKITMIPYGAPRIESISAKCLDDYGIKANEYALVIARPEPENSIYEIVKAYSEKKRSVKLVILGSYKTEENVYHSEVKAVANDDVLFLGAIYDTGIVQSLRFYSRLYIHGHQVGGTNPSLVESLGTGSAVLAHNNKYNRWVAKNSALYFDGVEDLSLKYDEMFESKALIDDLKYNSRANFKNNFEWDDILKQYETLLAGECR